MIATLQQLRLIARSAGRRMSAAPAGPDRASPYAGEPTLAEVLDDPIIRSLMARDGVARDSLDALIAAARRSPL